MTAIDVHQHLWPERLLSALGAPFGWWGAVALDRPEADAVDRLLAAGATGISMPAGALASPRGLDRVGPLLERVERHPNVRLAEGHGEAAFYEAVITTLMERRA